ncbi:MAG: T9SS type A sorting domain-containing protein, partial [Leadbetterella sp.]
LTVMHESTSNDQQAGINIATAYGAGSNGANIYSEYVTVKNCKVYGHGAGGIASSGTDHITIEGNTVYGNSTRSALNTSGISIYKPKAGTSDSNYWGMIIRGNICYNNKCELDFYYNENGTIYQSDTPTDGNGIILDLFDNDGGNPKYAKRVLVENNLCYNNGGAGIKSYKSSLARVVNNTCYHNNSVLNLHGTSAEIIFYETGGVNSVYNEGIYNNVCVANQNLTTNPNYAMIVDQDMSKVYSNHLVGPGGKNTNYSYSTTGFSTSNTVRAISDQDYPKFVNASQKNFQLQSTSPLIGAYTETYYPAKDLIGTTRPQGTYADIGAYEYIYSTTTASTSCGQISNKGFETGDFTNWTRSSTSNASITSTSSQVKAGTYGAKITGTASIQYNTLVTVNGVQTVEFKCWAKKDGSPDNAYLQVEYLNSSNSVLRTDRTNVTETSWTEKKVNASSPSGTAKVRVQVYKSGGGNLYVDDFCLTRTNNTAKLSASEPFSLSADDESSVMAYPNPANDYVSIPVYSQASPVMQVSILDSKGQEVKSNTLNVPNGAEKVDVDIRKIIPGIYFMNTSIGNNKKSFKVLKQ